MQAGQVLVRFDSEALRANISVAQADAKVAASQVPVLDSAIDKTFDKERDINSALRKINKAMRQLQEHPHEARRRSCPRLGASCPSSRPSARSCRVDESKRAASCAKSISSLLSWNRSSRSCLPGRDCTNTVGGSGAAEPATAPRPNREAATGQEPTPERSETADRSRGPAERRNRSPA